MADRQFQIIQRREWRDPGTPDEVFVLGTGVDHGDGTATVTPAEGVPLRPDADGVRQVLVDIGDLTDGATVGPVSTSLVYQE